MKRYLLSLLLLWSIAFSVRAIDYHEAQKQAWYLTDKMAYELNLSYEQYDLVYEINLDYFLRINNRYDIEGNGWLYRHTDLQYVLQDWQYSLYANTPYFYMPIEWRSSSWSYPVHTHYASDVYYFNSPSNYRHYRGATTSRGRNDMSLYAGRVINYTRSMRDEYKARTMRPHTGESYASHQRERGTAPFSHNAQRRNERPMDSRPTPMVSPRDLEANTIPPLRIKPNGNTEVNTSRIGRASSTRTTGNTNRGQRPNP